MKRNPSKHLLNPAIMVGVMTVINQMKMFGESVMPAEFDWNLNPQAANRLFLKPIFASSNPLTDIFSVMRRVKTEAVMYYLGHPSKIIQRNDDCKFTPKGQMSMSQRKINVYRCKINMQQCNDEFFDTCLEYALGDELDIFDPESSEHLRALKNAMLTHIQIATINDMFKLGFFADRSLTDDFYNVTDGVYKFIDEAVVAGDITEVNAGSGSAYSAGDANTLLQAVHRQSNKILRNLPKNQKSYLVDEETFDNLIDYYKALGTEEANRLIVNGVPTGSYLYDGIPVIKIAEFGYVLEEDFGLTNPHRVIYQANGALKLATDIAGSATKFRVYLDQPHQKTWFYDAAFKLGANYVHNELITVAK